MVTSKSFRLNILEYIDQLKTYGEVKEYNTWIKATCPVCSGTLKINKLSGAYSCYTNNCQSNPYRSIRQALYIDHGSIRQSSVFAPKYHSKPRLVDIVKPIKLENVDPTSFLTDQSSDLPKIVTTSEATYTHYSYDTFQVVRRDSYEGKSFHFEYLDENKNVVKEIPTQLDLPFYQVKFIQPNIVIVEGEKCATIAQQLGLAAITLPAFLYSERYLDRTIAKLKLLGVTGVLCLQDNDLAGFAKSDLIQKYLWKHKIPTKVVNIVNLFTEYVNILGFDIYDAYVNKLISKSTIINFIQDCLC